MNEFSRIWSTLHPISVTAQHPTVRNFDYHVTASWATERLQDLLPFLNFMSPIVS